MSSISSLSFSSPSSTGAYLSTVLSRMRCSSRAGDASGGGVEQVELVVDALFVANECEGVAGAGEEVQFAEAHFFFFVEVDGGADDGEEGVAVSF